MAGRYPLQDVVKQAWKNLTEDLRCRTLQLSIWRYPGKDLGA
jgi:hypothetical protein